MNDENLIVIKKTTVKRKLGNILGKMLEFYIDLNIELTLFWRRLFSKESRILILLSNRYIALFFNILLFAFIGQFFGGLINQVMFYGAFFNIITMMFNVMGWIDKLQGK